MIRRLLCRLFGHRWSIWRVAPESVEMSTTCILRKQCSRCGAERERLDRWGNALLP